MRYLFVLTMFCSLGIALGQEGDSGLAIYSDVLQCSSSEPVERTGDFRVDVPLGDSIDIEDVVTELLRLDFEHKQDILEFEFPPDWDEELDGSPYALRFDEYLSSSIGLRAARCFVENYQQGDRIRRWSSTSNPTVGSQGFALIRDERVAVSIMTHRILY
jgi:hypothetical protein